MLDSEQRMAVDVTIPKSSLIFFDYTTRRGLLPIASILWLLSTWAAVRVDGYMLHAHTMPCRGW